MRGVEVIDGGLQATVQDSGRNGYLGKGIPPAGAQDNYSWRASSVLVGNVLPAPMMSPGPVGDAGIEFLFKGPKLRFQSEAVVAVTGGDFAPRMNGEPVPMWTSLGVPAGGVLEIGVAQRGLRGYVAIAGGIDVPPHLGSRSTYLTGSMGGLEGRALRAGDVLPLFPPKHDLDSVAGRVLDESLRQTLGGRRLRVVPGPQEHRFSDEGVAAFYESEWKLSPVSNRMGFRFDGPTLGFNPRPEHLVRDAGSGIADIVDDVIPLGGIQVPGGTEAIVLGVEVPSVGGYAKIGTVITADLSKIGQIRPGETARFTRVAAGDSISASVEDERALEEAAKANGWIR